MPGKNALIIGVEHGSEMMMKLNDMARFLVEFDLEALDDALTDFQLLLGGVRRKLAKWDGGPDFVDVGTVKKGDA